jgi:hypothetical protein
MKVSPPTIIMSTPPWHTIAKRNILFDLMELLLQAIEEGTVDNANTLDEYLMDFWEGDDMDVDTLPSVESDDLIEDLDFGEETSFDLIRELLPLTVVYREYILLDLQSNVEFNTWHLQLNQLSEVECIDNFQFRKEDLTELFDLLRKPMETVLEFVARMTDLVKVKNQYTILYETGLLVIIYRLLHPHRV